MESLSRRIATGLSRPVQPAVRAFAAQLAEAAPTRAVLFYGSNLRSHSLDGVLDFYRLVAGEDDPAIWPRVSYHEAVCNGVRLRAKVATMTLSRFARAAAGGLDDTTIWARFVQPCALAWHRDAQAAEVVAAAIVAATTTAARLAAALGPREGPAEEFWTTLFRATYRAELRVERPGRERAILAADPAHYEGLLPLALNAAGIGCAATRAWITPNMGEARRREVLEWWQRRRRLAIPLNLLRLLRATGTFEGAARYAAWKLERHTGVAVELTPWRERHPVLAAPMVLWSIWRARRRA